MFFSTQFISIISFSIVSHFKIEYYFLTINENVILLSAKLIIYLLKVTSNEFLNVILNKFIFLKMYITQYAEKLKTLSWWWVSIVIRKLR